MKVLNNAPTGYVEKRIFHDLELVHAKDFFYYLNIIKHKLTGIGYNPFFKGLFYYPKNQKTKAVFFNSINLGNNPWEVTFETTLPRLGNVPKLFYDIAIKHLAKDNCKKITALSQCAYDMQIAYLKENYPQNLSVIERKMIIKLPYQEKYIHNYSEKLLPKDELVFTLVGADFFRKGGREVLKVFDKLIPENPHLYLNIVSSMQYNDYATHTTKEGLDRAMSIINKFPENITHYTSLPNDIVIELFKKSHIGLLPTWADTFGFSVLEAQACGCPVITTDIRALPEVNNNDVGWVIKVPKDEFGNGILETEDDREVFSNSLKNDLYKIINSLMKSDIIHKTNILINEF